MTLWKNVPKRLVGDNLEVQKHSQVPLTFASDTGDEGLRWLELSSWKHHVWNAPYPLHVAVFTGNLVNHERRTAIGSS